jgi:hypothetical protein
MRCDYRNMMPDFLLTEDDLADRWRLKKSTLRMWRHRKRGPAYVKLGQKVRYRMAAVLAFEQHQEKADHVLA